jgi:hypothetical protein
MPAVQPGWIINISNNGWFGFRSVSAPISISGKPTSAPCDIEKDLDIAKIEAISSLMV